MRPEALRRGRAAGQPRPGDRLPAPGASCAGWPTRAARWSSSSIASRRRSSCGPTACCTWSRARRSYLGPVDGFLEIADPALVKLPFEAIVAQARRRTHAAICAPVSPPPPHSPEPDLRHAHPTRVGHAAPRRVPGRAGGLWRGRDPARRERPPGGHRDGRHPRPQCLGQDDALQGGHEAPAADGRQHRRRWRGHRQAPRGGDGAHLRLRLPEPEPDVLRPDGQGGADLRPDQPGCRPRHLRRADARLAGARRPRRRGGHPRAAAA